MSSFRLQYQAWAEPLFTGGAPPETVTLDKWHRPASEPTRKTFCFAAIAPCLFFVPAETVTLDKWFQPTSQPVLRVSSHPSRIPFSVQAKAPEVATLDKWFRPASEPVRYPRVHPSRVPATFYVRVPGEGPITLDKWYQPASEPQRQPRRILPRTGYFFFTDLDLAAAPVPDMDSWFMPTQQPHFARRPTVDNPACALVEEMLSVIPGYWAADYWAAAYWSAGYWANTNPEGGEVPVFVPTNCLFLMYF